MLKVLAQKPWYETAAIVDTREETLNKAAVQNSLKRSICYTDLTSALRAADAEAVLVNTQSDAHYALTRLALEAGRHALVAKPVTNDYAEAVELVQLADRQRVTLSVGHQIRYNRHYTAVRRFLESEPLGPVEVVNFLNTKPRHQAHNQAAMPQPALHEISCHHFDSLMSLFPDRVPESITCDGFQPSWSVYSGPCMVNALIRLSGGIHVLYHGGFSSQADCYELRLEGSRGALRCRGLHMSNDTMAYEFAERGQRLAPCELDEGIPAIDPFLPFLDLWYDYLRGGAEPPFSGRRNLPIFALLSAGIDSIESGQAVTIAGNPRYDTAFRSD
jgi:predicted dehydrogenase